ncbi:hypothetical protein [Culturomica massiliensis]|jgi:predicted enzyme related to lactoylglutathione lyase|uniref:hypothetical protein n=1 Tax=Culturomica massiliensis TaxID=1841857 RepID=UPI000E55F928|nr:MULTISPECIES: hypothetical protein [Odoribacteraceae]RHV89185.1 hypothetical protein DXA95_16195 [Odoribacter sp. OF09-27XD]
MKKDLVLKGATKLNGQQMKSVTGGGAAKFLCSCSQHAGTWTHVYHSVDDMTNAINRYCEGGGNCTQIKTD